MNRIINSYLIILLIHSTISEQSLQCGDWSLYTDEKCFKILESVELQKFEDAINTCHQNEGSSLVTIHSQNEQEFLFNLLTNIHKQSNNVWIGAKINDKLFKWSDNTTVNYTNWANDNPRNTSDYDCVQMSLTEPNSIGTTFGSGDDSTTFTLPDLRGEFIRGWSDGRDVDSERLFASFQWGSSIPYVFSINNKWQVSSATGQFEHMDFAGKTFDGGFQTDITLNQTRNGMIFNGRHNQIFSYFNDATSVGNITQWTILKGTRQRNIALLACIKY